MWLSNSYLLKKVLQESVKLIQQLVEELRAGNVHPVEDGELLITEIVVCGRTGLQDFILCVLIHNLPDLSQQGIQVLQVRTELYGIEWETGHEIKNAHKPFLTVQLCRCPDQRISVFATNWLLYQYQRSTMTRQKTVKFGGLDANLL